MCQPNPVKSLVQHLDDDAEQAVGSAPYCFFCVIPYLPSRFSLQSGSLVYIRNRANLTLYAFSLLSEIDFAYGVCNSPRILLPPRCTFLCVMSTFGYSSGSFNGLSPFPVMGTHPMIAALFCIGTSLEALAILKNAQTSILMRIRFSHSCPSL